MQTVAKFSIIENEQQNLSLNEEELSKFVSYSDLTAEEKEMLKDLVFNLSIVLYKSFKHEPT